MSESLIEKLARLEEGVAEVKSAISKQGKSKANDKPIDITATVEESIKKIVTVDFITKLYKG